MPRGTSKGGNGYREPPLASMFCEKCEARVPARPGPLPGIGVEWRCSVCGEQLCIDSYHPKEVRDGG